MGYLKSKIIKIVAIILALVTLALIPCFLLGVFHKHDYDSFVIRATCTREGYTSYSCKCGDTYTAEPKPKLAHDIEDIISTPPLCFKVGLTEGKKCKNCSYVELLQQEIPALNTKHQIENGTCTVCGVKELAIVYSAKILNTVDGYEDWQFKICKLTKLRTDILRHELIKDIIVPYTLENTDEHTTYTVIALESNLFSKYVNTQTITLQDNIVEIGESAFKGAISLERISVDENNTAFCDVDFTLYSKDKKTLIACPAKKQSVILTKQVNEIKDYAFYDCEQLQSVFYEGSIDDLAQVALGENNTPLQTATWYYFSESAPTGEGNFWHYENGVPTVWE